MEAVFGEMADGGGDELGGAMGLGYAPAASEGVGWQAHEHYERGYPPIRRPSRLRIRAP